MKKYIISIFILLSVCFISLNVLAAEFSSNEEIINYAAEMLRDAMIDRQGKVEITIKNICKDDEYFSIRDYAEKIYNKVKNEELSTYSSGGSYLIGCIKGLSYGGEINNVEKLQDGSKLYTAKVYWNLSYHTTKEQEIELETEIKKWVLNNIDPENDSDFDKIFKVYKYITNHVEYDYSYQKYTAYDAFFEKTSVCQGFSSLLYKMLKESGINDTLIIYGTANNGNQVEGHAWNIVKLGNKYYYLDATWDEDDTLPFFAYFLRGSDFIEYTHWKDESYNTAEFKEIYTISDEDFLFLTNKIIDKDGILTGFNVSNGVIKEENLVNDGYFRDDISTIFNITSNQGIIGTNSRIEIKKDGILLQRFVVVIYGDINGDGKITAIDALNLIKGINGKIYFEDPYTIEAGRIITKGERKPSAVDALAIIKHLNGKYIINQS